MSQSSECPSEVELVNFVNGGLDGSVIQRVQAHLACCQLCANAVEWLRAHPIRSGGDDSEPADSQQTPSLHSTMGKASGRQRSELFEEVISTNLLLEPSTNPEAKGRLGNYDILSVLGIGGMGMVFKAFDDKLHRVVAIKVLKRLLAASPTAKRRFLREARAAAAINHPCVVTIHAVEQHKEIPFLVMEYVDGIPLRQRMRQKPRLEPMEIIRLSQQIASGLAAAHAQGVIHRDVKPGNVMLERGGIDRVKITDFGLARVARDNEDLTTHGMAVGTPAYMAPEQFSGQGKIDLRADLFSLGCVMYAMATGASPFHGRVRFDVARRIAEEDPPALDEVRPDIPRFFSEIVSRLLQKKPDDRYQSATEVAELLKRHLSVINQTPTDEMDAVLRAGLLTPKDEAARKSNRWARSILAALGIALVIALTCLGFWASRGDWARRAGPAAPSAGPLPGQYPETVTVGASTDADVRTIGEALAKAGPGTEIRLLDAGPFNEMVVIDNPAKWRDITIVGEALAVVTAPSNGMGGVFKIEGTPGVTLRNLRVLPEPRQHAVILTGAAPGSTLDGLRIQSPPGSQFAQIYIREQATGTPDRPIRVIHSVLAGDDKAIVVEGDVGRPVAFVQIQQNRFWGHRVHVQLNREVHDVQVTGNILVGGMVGLALTFTSANHTHHILVANNTLLRTPQWLDLRHTIPQLRDVRICNNLILGSEKVGMFQPENPVLGERSLVDFVERWSFSSNWWEPGPNTDTGQLALVANQLPHVDFTLSDPSDRQKLENPDFLRPPPDSLLAGAGAGGPLPKYVGAVCPAGANP